MALVAEHAALSDIGLQRTTNEDSFLAAPPLFVVADGMGGAAAGELASSTAVEILSGAVAAGSTLADATKQANLGVFKRAGEDASRWGMGTTLTALRLGEGNERAELVHVGDSRAYLLRAGVLAQLTDDHSLVGEMVRSGKLTPEAALHHPARSVLSRALGTEPSVKVDRREVGLRAGDVVLLCSDGLTSAVLDATIKALLEGAAPREAARRLVREAKNQGGHDNITVVVLRLSAEEPVADGDERTAVLATADEERTGVLAVTDDETTGEFVGPPGAAVAGAAVSGDADIAATAPLPPPVEAAAASAGAPPSRGLSGRRLWLLVAGVLLAVVLIAAAITLNVSYYVGVDRGYVSVYKGLPYSLAGVDLSSVYLRTQTAASSVAPEDQHLLTEHTVTSKDGALSTVEALRTAAPTPVPLPGASPGSGTSPSGAPSPGGTASPRLSPGGTL